MTCSQVDGFENGLDPSPSFVSSTRPGRNRPCDQEIHGHPVEVISGNRVMGRCRSGGAISAPRTGEVIPRPLEAGDQLPGGIGIGYFTAVAERELEGSVGR